MTPHPSISASVLGDYEVTHVSKWKLGEWIAFLSGVTAAVVWGWRRVVKPFLMFFKNFCTMPGTIMKMQARQADIWKMVVMSNGRSRALLDYSAVPTWESDENGCCVFCNRAMLALLDRPPSDLLGQQWMGVIADEDKISVFAEWGECVKHHRDFNRVYHWVDGRGDRIQVRAHARRIICERGDTLGWIGEAQPIGAVRKPPCPELTT